MRLATVTVPGAIEPCAARLMDDHLVVLPAVNLVALFAQAQWAITAAVPGGQEVDLAEPGLVWHPPVRPAKTLCVGLNYRQHIAETGQPTPEFPTIFGKWSDTLTGPYDPIVLPRVSDAVDWEVELGLVIGTEVRSADEATAAAAIAGYTIVNDISMRDWQNRTNQWHAGKNFEHSTPVGPCVVTPDEIDGAADLAITCQIGDEVMQSGRTSDLVFGPAAIVAYVSQFTRLRPGDLIATGTPSGIGNQRTPRRFLTEGETLVSTIEGIGEMTNLVTQR